MAEGATVIPDLDIYRSATDAAPISEGIGAAEELVGGPEEENAGPDRDAGDSGAAAGEGAG